MDGHCSCFHDLPVINRAQPSFSYLTVWILASQDPGCVSHLLDAVIITDTFPVIVMKNIIAWMMLVMMVLVMAMTERWRSCRWAQGLEL